MSNQRPNFVVSVNREALPISEASPDTEIVMTVGTLSRLYNEIDALNERVERLASDERSNQTDTSIAHRRVDFARRLVLDVEEGLDKRVDMLDELIVEHTHKITELDEWREFLANHRHASILGLKHRVERLEDEIRQARQDIWAVESKHEPTVMYDSQNRYERHSTAHTQEVIKESSDE